MGGDGLMQPLNNWMRIERKNTLSIERSRSMQKQLSDKTGFAAILAHKKQSKSKKNWKRQRIDEYV